MMNSWAVLVLLLSSALLRLFPSAQGFSTVPTSLLSRRDESFTLPRPLGDMPLPEDFLNGIMKGLADLGGDGDFNPDSMIDGMMEHLLAKDLMYEPMKQVTVKFPDWLKEHKDSLSVEDYAEREKQYQCFCDLVKVYETEPNNVARLMDLMQQVQEFGQPPPEIVKEIAPGVELDEEGLPKLDASGMPLDGDCRIM